MFYAYLPPPPPPRAVVGDHLVMFLVAQIPEHGCSDYEQPNVCALTCLCSVGVRH